jgi:hypothetical protein
MRARGGHATPVTIALRAGLAAAVRASPAAGLLGGADGEDIRSALARGLATARFLRIDANHPVVRATLGADIPPGALLRRCPSPPPPAAAGASGALPLPLPPPSPAAGLLLPLRHTKSVRQPGRPPLATARVESTTAAGRQHGQPDTYTPAGRTFALRCVRYAGGPGPALSESKPGAHHAAGGVGAGRLAGRHRAETPRARGLGRGPHSSPLPLPPPASLSLSLSPPPPTQTLLPLPLPLPSM